MRGSIKESAPLGESATTFRRLILLTVLLLAFVGLSTFTQSAQANTVTITFPTTGATLDAGVATTGNWTATPTTGWRYDGATVRGSVNGGSTWKSLGTTTGTSLAYTPSAAFSRNAMVSVEASFTNLATNIATTVRTSVGSIKLRFGGELTSDYTLPTDQGIIEMSGDVHVGSSYTLTVPDGVTVQSTTGDDVKYASTEGLITGKNEIIISGTISMESTSNTRTFNGVQANSDTWGGFLFKPASKGTIQNCTIQHAASGVGFGSNVNAITIQNNTFQQCKKGINFTPGTAAQTFSNNTFRDSDIGIYIQSGSGESPTITGATITNNTTGISILGLNPTITSSTITYNGVGVSIEAGSPTITNCTIEGQTQYGVYINGASTNPVLGNYSTIGAGGNKLSDNGPSDGTSINVYNNSVNTIMADGNDWGLRTRGNYLRSNATIEASIRDNDDASGVGKILFAPEVIDSILREKSSGNTEQTTSRTVTFSASIPRVVSGSTPTQYQVSENSSFSDGTWTTYSTTGETTLSEGNGTKTVYYKARDAKANESNTVSDTIILNAPDTTAPTMSTFKVDGLTTGTRNISRTPAISATVTDNVSIDLSTLKIQFVGQSNTVTVTSGITFSSDGTLSYQFTDSNALPADTYTATLSAKDTSGNPASASISTLTVVSTADTTAPTISDLKADGVSIANGDTLANTPAITATLRDDSGSGINASTIQIIFTGQKNTNPITITQGITYIASTGAMSLQWAQGNSLTDDTYSLTIRVNDNSSNQGSLSRTGLIVSSGTTGLSPNTTPLPYPNPFKPSTQSVDFTYTLGSDSTTRLYLFDLTGNVIWRREFAAGTTGGQAGYNTVTWNGVSDLGGSVGNGVYILKIVQAGKVIGTLKVIALE